MVAFGSQGNGEGSSSDTLLRELAVKGGTELEHEFAALREHVAELEAELTRYRAREQLIGQTLLSATSFAMKTRETARREAELILSKASEWAVEQNATLERGAREREKAERELLRLRQLTEEMQAGLAGFLKTTLLRLGLEVEADQKPKPEGVPHAPDAARVDQALANALQAAIPPEAR